MHTPSQLNGEIALVSSESFGRIRRRQPSAVISPRRISGRAADRTASVPARDEIEAYALHAFAANGFGDADVGFPEQRLRPTRPQFDREAHAHRPRPTGGQLDHEAHAHRLLRLLQSVEATLRAVGAAARRMHAKWKQRQQARATYVALGGLDARTLRDLGFDRSEIRSVAAEVAGETDSTRARLVLGWRELPL